jgi:O-methyltransferase
MTKFGILAKLNFLQDWLSNILVRLNPAVIHNLEKYYVLKKVHYLSAIEEVEGDYLEFGVYTGSSFCHSMRCCGHLVRYNEALKNTRFFGFDSFEGFGELGSDELHSFYTDQNFKTSYEGVLKRARRSAGSFEFKLIKGFFSDTLNVAPEVIGIGKARIVFIDSDTYSSSRDALNFVSSTVQCGTFLILDDFFSYKGDSERGVAKAFNEFVESNKLNVRKVFTYGMGGVVYVVSGINV